MASQKPSVVGSSDGGPAKKHLGGIYPPPSWQTGSLQKPPPYQVGALYEPHTVIYPSFGRQHRDMCRGFPFSSNPMMSRVISKELLSSPWFHSWKTHHGVGIVAKVFLELIGFAISCISYSMPLCTIFTNVRTPPLPSRSRRTVLHPGAWPEKWATGAMPLGSRQHVFGPVRAPSSPPAPYYKVKSFSFKVFCSSYTVR